jgi:hypothetical protein|tara:strand:+ start:348 stop:587 length:240 start_codon:yes stop_codon:yes gene_type:complete
MTEEVKENSFTLDNVNYEIDKVSEEARYLVFSLNRLNQKRAKIQDKLSIINAAELTFVERLRKALKETEEEKEEKETGA